MEGNAFQSATFKYGWNVKSVISIWGKRFDIIVTAKAYLETDSVTSEQESAYASFLANEDREQQAIEALLEAFAGKKEYALSRFRPTKLLFQKDGGYALLCDDTELPDEGVAVCLSPKKMVISQDAYL